MDAQGGCGVWVLLCQGTFKACILSALEMYIWKEVIKFTCSLLLYRKKKNKTKTDSISLGKLMKCGVQTH